MTSMGGEGGEGASSAGKGGSVSVGGSAGTMTGDSGEGGEGGEGGAPTTAAEECTSCAASACRAELERCEGSPSCATWLACVSGCDDASCAEDCDAETPEVVLLTTAIYECLCTSSCDDECDRLDACDRTCVEGAGPPASSATTAPAVLTDTGLYTRATGSDPWEIAAYAQHFEPEYELWADGAVKERYIYLPRCQAIDTTDMDHWSFPVGTRIWKEFTRDGVRVETRLLWRFGAGVSDWVMATYQWPLPVGQADPDPEQAALAPDTGVQNVNGTSHDIPGVANGCVNCHGKLSERVLGFGAIQLSHSLGGLTFTELADRGVISSAPLRGGYHPPGDATAQAALGYLHVNCGNCHNETGQATNNPPATESLWLRLLVGQTTVAMTHAQTTAINRMTGNPNFVMDRIEPMQPAQSSMIVRMERNPTIGETLQMPPVARELPDPTGIGLVTDWVNALAP
jgi:hypothetical protein